VIDVAWGSEKREAKKDKRIRMNAKMRRTKKIDEEEDDGDFKLVMFCPLRRFGFNPHASAII